MRTTRIAAAVGCAAAVVALVPLPASASTTAGQRTVASRAVATVRHDGRTRTDTDFDLRRAGPGLTAASNTAVAYARCRDCRALAVSFQIVLVRRLPTDLAATNRAIAVTDRCTRCEAVSRAYQWIVVTGPDRRLSWAGQRQLQRLGWRLRSVVQSRPAAAELDRRVAALAAQVRLVLAREVRQWPVQHVWSARARR
jgi:putative peptide zinc metalloprotease protein